jgi:hypothetical protein
MIKTFEKYNENDPYGEEIWEEEKPITLGRHVIRFTRPVTIELYFGYYNQKNDYFRDLIIKQEAVDERVEFNVTIMDPRECGVDFEENETLIRIWRERAMGWLPNDSFAIVK